jgi:hypothetical protein
VRSTDGVLGGLQDQLVLLHRRIEDASRRSRRFSWYAWGFLFAVLLGTGLSDVLLIEISFSCQCGPTVGLGGLAVLLVGFLPAFGLVGLALWEIFAGRRAALHPPATAEPPPVPPPAEWPGWTETVRQSQQRVTHMRSEIEVAFVPLILGTFATGTFLGAEALQWDAGAFGLYGFLLIYAVAVPFLLLLVPVYWAARQWSWAYQAPLDAQTQGLTRLESEFLERFAGVNRPG